MKFSKPKGLSYQETIRFHGHNGPFLALGYRLGKFLVKRHKPKGIMDFKITVKTNLKKPFTCLIDGLQCSTMATLGKGNISAINSGKPSITITVRMRGERFDYEITKQAFDLCCTATDLNKAAKRILVMPASHLWKRMK